MINTNNIEAVLEQDKIVFITYGSFLTQSLISGIAEAVEMECESAKVGMKISTNMLTIFIELSQNMMNYTRKIEIEGKEFNPKGIIIIGKTPEDSYYILSQNVISLDDKNKIEPKLQGILDTDLAGIKKLYKEARRSGKDTHSKGGGIGFYEIAKRCSNIKFDFKEINESRYTFKFMATL